MMSNAPWFQDLQALQSYLHIILQKAQLVPVLDNVMGQTRFWINLEIPRNENILLSVSVRGDTLQFTAHNAIPGELTEQSFANINQVNLTPWGGRAYSKLDNNGIALALGIPLPPTPDLDFPIDFYIHVIANAVCQLRAGVLPDDYGLVVPSVDLVLKEHMQWATNTAVSFNSSHQDQFLVIDTYSPAGHEVRLELFMVNNRLSATRVHAQITIQDTQLCLRACARINQNIMAGALAWDEQTNHLAATTILYPAVSALSQQHISWAVEQSLTVFDLGMQAVAAQADLRLFT